ncbi:MAG: ABC transporter substrate-binding protein [Duncaniella sp.]|nr:ABC transporter substrate-binding protein [Duncaniella sp.]
MYKNLSFLLPVLMLLAASCGSGSSGNTAGNTEKLDFKYASLLSIERADSFDIARIKNPWDTTRILHTYIIVPDSTGMPSSLPEGTVVRTPLKRAVVYSTIHTDLFRELGVFDAVKGVADVPYVTDSLTLSAVASGTIIDCGMHTSPAIEKIIALEPDGVLVSPYENSGSYGKLGQLGIPIIECADYMETSPLGRAEWVKFFGLLTGRYEEACAMFEAEELRYDSLKAKVADVSSRPRVLMDQMYGGTWYVPRKDATISIYIRDAGGENPFDDLGGAGSASLSGEKVLHSAGDAPLWLIRYSQSSPLTLKQLGAENNLYSGVEAFRNDNVWGANSSVEDYFSITPFHPSLFLDDLIKVIHPEVSDTVASPRFFHKLQ